MIIKILNKFRKNDARTYLEYRKKENNIKKYKAGGPKMAEE